MKIPAFLKKGDTVAIVCPASYIKGNIDKGIAVLESWGLQVKVGKTVSSQQHQFAGSDELRAADMQAALDDPAVKAIFAARGGYGTVRIIDELNFSKFEAEPKWLIGFSDITVLHSHIHQLLNTATIHGQMPKSFEASSAEGLSSLRKCLFGEMSEQSYSQKTFPNRPGIAEGQLIGGNLSILHSILGSVSDMDYAGKILFIEDVGEMLYNVDRMLWTLKRAGKLSKLAGLILGGFTHLRDTIPGFGQRFEEIIFDKVKAYDFPVAFDYPAGHMEDNRSLIFGKNIVLEVKNEETSIKYQ